MGSREFPRLSEDIARLADGLRSLTETRAKASLLRGLIEVRGQKPLPKTGPSELLGLIHELPAPTSWISEAHLVAAHYYLADADGVNEKDFIETTYRSNRALT